MVAKKKSSSNSPSKSPRGVSQAVARARQIPGVKSVDATETPLALVSLRDLAKRCGLSAHAARVRLNKAGVKRPGTRWRFKAESIQLARAVKVLEETFYT